MNTQSIGIFDSGLGGLTVMNAITDLLPHENIIYFGDTINLPYGSKSKEALLQCCKDNILLLKGLGVKLVVIACHTASIASYADLENISSSPIVNVVDSSLGLLKKLPNIKHLVLLGTQQTVSSGIYKQKLSEHLPKSKITAIPCPLFVSLVEEGYAEHPIAKTIIQSHLSPLKKEEIDTLLLGCTHYPLLKNPIKASLSRALKIIDPSNQCAIDVKKKLTTKNLLNLERKKPTYQFLVSDNSERFLSLAKKLLKHPLEHVSLIKTSCI